MSDARISNVRIIYNQHNIDSALAAAYFCTVLRKADQHVFGDLPREPLNIVTQHYDCVRHTPSKNKVDVLYVLGVSLLGPDLLGEIDACQPKEVIEFHYQPSAVKFDPANAKYHYREITPITHDGQLVTNEEDVTEASIAVLVAEYIERSWTMGITLRTDPIKRLIKAAAHYINFKRFDRFFKFDEAENDTSNVTPATTGECTAEDLAFLYRNFERIHFSASTTEELEVNSDYKFDAKHFMTPVSVARNIIHRNMIQANYSNAQKYVIIPTVCVGEESAIEVMRQLSYPYKTVITYEDVRNQRIWRIYAQEAPKIMDFLRSVIKPTEEWCECKIFYMVTDVPTINKN